MRRHRVSCSSLSHHHRLLWVVLPQRGRFRHSEVVVGRSHIQDLLRQWGHHLLHRLVAAVRLADSQADLQEDWKEALKDHPDPYLELSELP